MLFPKEFATEARKRGPDQAPRGAGYRVPVPRGATFFPLRIGTSKVKGPGVMAAAAAIELSSEQRETLRQAMTDAVYFRDPPVQCADCPA
jgi:hypothetical protein